MKLAELEENARSEMAAEERKVIRAAEEFRQKVIAWLAAEKDLDEAELQEVISIHDVEYKLNTWDRNRYYREGTALKAIHLNISKHKPIIFAVEEAMGQLHMVGQYMVGHKARPVYDLGVALVVAADEWEKEDGVEWL